MSELVLVDTENVGYNIIKTLGDVTISDMGKIIGLAISKTDGRADGKIVSQITQELLKK